LAEVTLSGTTGADTLTGAYGVEDIVTVNGLEGDDLIYIAGGHDVGMNGGLGHDTMVAALSGGENSFAGLYGGAGNDILQASGFQEHLAIAGEDGSDTVLLDLRGSSTTERSILNIDMGSGDDVIVGTYKSADATENSDQSFDLGTGNDVVNMHFDLGVRTWIEVNSGKGDDVVRWSFAIDPELAQTDRINVWAYLGEGDDVLICDTRISGKADVHVYGQDGDDLIRITGNAQSLVSGGAGDDRIVFDTKSNNYLTNSTGGAGNDVFVAGLSMDTFGGGAGADVFVFGSAAKASGDQIVGFRHGVDRIDLSRFMEDATFVGAKKFSGDGPEIRFATDKQDFTYLSGDVNGDGKVDWKVLVTSNGAVTASDLIL
jgi:Ca2+-binding RTX toxin-like protein